MAVYLIGNCQFGRASIIKQNKRPFQSVQEMNAEMIERWNANVTDNDEVIHLGNFAWDPTTAQEMLTTLNGKRIYLVPGEFDSAIMDLQANKQLPPNATVVNRIFDEAKLKATMAYWPLLEWPKKQEGHYLYYGYYATKYKPDHKKKMINMAAEFWNYTPHKIDQLIHLFNDTDVE